MKLCVLGSANSIALSGSRVTVSLTALNQQFSTLTVGLLLAVFSFLPLLLAVPSGRWIDRIGAYRPLLLGSGLLCLGMLVSGVLSGPWALLATASMMGLGGMLQQVASQSVLGRGDPTDRLRNYSWSALSQSSAAACGPALAGLMIDHAGFSQAFLLLALPPLGAIWMLHRGQRALKTVAPPRVSAPAARHRIADLLMVPSLRQLLAVTIILTGAWDTHMFAVPIFGNEIGLSATRIGAILSSFAAGTFAIRLVVPFLHNHVHPWTLTRAAMLLTVFNFLAYPLFTGGYVLMGMSFLLGLALGASQPGVMAMIYQATPPGRQAEAAGLRLACVNCSQVSLPLLFGLLGSAIGVGPLFWVYAVCLAIGSWKYRRPPVETRHG
ncbi:MFS transporter [Pigmentiphaga aceris]|uniref:MFS transporter n=2 Tax=Pigmentiphaga aceris TaxID=1940612 RepID=A0A5C0B8I5_9BURK|nr:MFS transporter [Pigmentiphaga aceris]